jgi:osmoprotectant transport system substrate-binding protein
MNRRNVLAALGAAALLPGCSQHYDVAVGSKDFTEELIVGEMYATLLEKSGLVVKRRLDLGGSEVAMVALQRGDIDLYPEYTGTALIAQLHQTPSKSGAANYETVKRAYASKYDLTWLEPSPFNDTQALATTQAIAQRYNMRTLEDLSKAAPQLRLGAIPEFTKRPDGLPGLQKAFGGFNFKEVRLFDIGLKYKALESGQVDVVVAFGTDGQLDVDRLFVFVDDRHFWPEYNIAPVVRAQALAKHPQIASALNKLAPLLTDEVMRGLNARVDGKHEDPSDVAHGFLQTHGLA